MFVLMAFLVAVVIQQGPVSNGRDFGSCLTPDRRPLDLRGVMLLQNRELLLDRSSGRVRAVLEDQRFKLHIEDSPDDELLVEDVGGKIGGSTGRADVFLTLGYLDDRPVLYWRETYQHRSFRQGLLSISPEAARGPSWTRMLTHLCEGRGGVDTSH